MTFDMFVNHPFLASLRLALVGAAFLLLVLAAGCSYSHGDPAPCDVANETITYSGVISPIFDAHCRECHSSSEAAIKGGGHDFGNYAGIHSYPAFNMLGCIQHAPGFDPMPQGRAMLSDCDILRIKAWMDANEPNN